jgi:asparagine synthase (glutamine-hydrolysing)
LCGIIGRPDSHHVARRFTDMFRAMDRGGRMVGESRVDEAHHCALGRVHLGVLQPAPQLARNGPITVLFHGELHNGAELRAFVAQADTVVEPGGDTALVAALYRLEGHRFAHRLKGTFSAALLDQAAGIATLITDRLGNYPLHWFADRDGLVFASELRAALRAHPAPALNAAAVADLLKFAFPMGDKTLAAGVDLVPTASTLTYCAKSGAVRIEPYAALADLFQPGAAGHDEYMQSVHAAGSAAMDRAVEGTHSYGLSLSGGLDTRVILSAMDRRGKTEATSTFTLGGRGCADEVIGYQLARMARTKHRFVALDDHYLDDLLPTVSRMVSLTDGMYLSHGFTEMLALQGFEQSDCSVLLRGHLGEIAKASTGWPFHTDQTVYAMKSTEGFAPYLLSRMTHVSRGDAARQLFTDSWIDRLNGFSAERSLATTVEGVSLSAPDLCSYVYLKEYHRRVTIPSLDIFRTVAEVRLPFADIDFLGAILNGSSKWRDGVAIHQALIGANNPAYLRVRNPNTGAPAGAGPVVEAVLDKMNTILRRLNVYGYRHYHSFDGWMRRALLDMVDSVVLAPETLARGIFRESAIRDRAAQARAGKLDHDDLLQALIVVELWLREMRIA